MNAPLSLVRALADPGAPRVLTSAMLARLGGEPVSPRTHDRSIARLVAAGLLVRVQRGLFLNPLAQPPAVTDEAVPFLAPGAIVSLQRALGACGVTNNPSRVVTAVVPIQPGLPPPSLGEIRTRCGVFRFHGIQSSVLFAGAPEDRLLDASRRPIPGSVPYATPEQALVDWIYLSTTPHGGLPPPPRGDVDVTLIDAARLARLALAAGVEEAAARWLDAARAAHASDWEDRMDRPAW